jgi:hypothetical protein
MAATAYYPLKTFDRGYKMKKILLIGTVILGLLGAALVFSAVPARDAVDGTYEMVRDTIIATGLLDTVKSATDSITFFSRTRFEPGWEYILVTDHISGTGNDSIKIRLRLDGFLADSGTVPIMSVNIDSITDSAGLNGELGGEAIRLPIGETVFGDRFTLKGLGYTEAGTQAIVTGAYIYKRRVLSQVRRR